MIYSFEFPKLPLMFSEYPSLAIIILLKIFFMCFALYYPIIASKYILIKLCFF